MKTTYLQKTVLLLLCVVIAAGCQNQVQSDTPDAPHIESSSLVSAIESESPSQQPEQSGAENELADEGLPLLPVSELLPRGSVVIDIAHLLDGGGIACLYRASENEQSKIGAMFRNGNEIHYVDTDCSYADFNNPLEVAGESRLYVKAVGDGIRLSREIWLPRADTQLNAYYLANEKTLDIHSGGEWTLTPENDPENDSYNKMLSPDKSKLLERDIYGNILLNENGNKRKLLDAGNGSTEVFEWQPYYTPMEWIDNDRFVYILNYYKHTNGYGVYQVSSGKDYCYKNEDGSFSVSYGNLEIFGHKIYIELISPFEDIQNAHKYLRIHDLDTLQYTDILERPYSSSSSERVVLFPEKNMFIMYEQTRKDIDLRMFELDTQDLVWETTQRFTPPFGTDQVWLNMFCDNENLTVLFHVHNVPNTPDNDFILEIPYI